ncbi:MULTISPECIES: M16 family metallopeptidase [unclassified Rhizobium]|uniref:M16 family metallopeptidase n=1 Tax=unclassified Rhizobium TaxID=2613769 RepID=UPI001A983896|nr:MULTISPECIES: M16 family metallopeptidase [unclassified Rhizobium]MBX5160538.1 insulinase family protein [Rhizobium sp. NZLR8]MBX5170519.1 insulinase family protein [Rhizobium sp. NZLR1b]MBX5201137.1 insulinase family protein [Rhizobium sp. NZLR1]QSZ19014.1 insulinase family protein [Rhizobium sp. NZLR1]
MSHKMECAAAWRFLATVSLVANFASPAYADTLSASWPQTQSDLQADSDVHFGTLANGMRFAIMRNATPPGQAAIRFRIGAGSLEENDNQQGLAHVLEHMAFKGSTHVAEGEIIRILQRKGLAFGPDTNAHTSYDETVYALDLPEVDADTVSTGLMLMRETASELTLDAGAFDRERGVILSEERLRDTPQYRAGLGIMNSLLAGQRATMRAPIGKADIISNAPVDLVRDYYRANYRPDRATLMVVGDIDPAAMEIEIRQRFGDWKGVGPTPAKPDLGTLETKGESTGVLVVPGGMTSVQIAWTRPYDATADTFAKRRTELVEDLGLMVLKRRVSTIASKADAPFISAGVGSQDLLDSAHVVLISANSEPDKWQAALTAIDQEQRRIEEFGVAQAEIDREILEYRSALQAAVAGAETRTTTDIASTLASSVDDNQVFTSPAQDLSLFETMTNGVTAAEVNQALQLAFTGNGPQVVLQTAQSPQAGADAVRQAYDASKAIAVSAPASVADVAWPYTHFGEPGAVVERRAVDDLGLTMVRFSNGVRLTVKPTKLRANEVLVREDIGRGRLDLPHDRPAPIWASPAVALSGVRAMDYQDVQKALTANIVGIDFSVGDSSFQFDGRTRTEDLVTQLQLMTAYTSDPAYRPEAFKRVQQAYLSGLDQYQATPGGVVSRDFAGLVHSGDPRWTFPDRAELSAAKPGDFEAVFRPMVSSGPIDITIVGDVTVDDAIRLTAETFGALPPRPEAGPSNARGDVRFPAANEKPVLLTHSGRADNAAAAVGAPIGDLLSDLPRSFTANIATQIFQNRLIDRFRITEGASYAVEGDANLSREVPGYGYAFFYVETAPAKIARFYALVDEIANDLRAHDVSPDEFARAREPIIETLKHQRQSNEYWIEYLRGAQTDARRLDRIRDNLSGYDKVTAGDIREFAKTYFSPEKFWKFEVLPAAVR